jgi:hypothetical protein
MLPAAICDGRLVWMGQSQANEWIHRLVPILKQALDDLGYISERDPRKFRKREQDRKDAVDTVINGPERRRQMPKTSRIPNTSGYIKTLAFKDMNPKFASELNMPLQASSVREP